jgi:hypothetical protein
LRVMCSRQELSEFLWKDTPTEVTSSSGYFSVFSPLRYPLLWFSKDVMLGTSRPRDAGRSAAAEKKSGLQRCSPPGNRSRQRNMRAPVAPRRFLKRQLVVDLKRSSCFAPDWECAGQGLCAGRSACRERDRQV